MSPMSMEEGGAAPQPSLGLYRRIATLFVLLTIGIVGFAVYMVFSRATVVVLSEPTETSAEFIVDVAKEPTDSEVPGGVFEDTQKLQQTFPASSVVTIDTAAEGRVRIISSLYRAQTLVATTRIVTPDGILFRLKDRVVIPAFGEAEVDVFADQVGPTGDIGDATFTIPGLNEETRKFFTVETVDPIAGGKKEVRMVTASDLEKAEGVMTEKLKTDMEAKFREKAEDAGVPMTGKMLSFSLVSKRVDVDAGEEVDDFTMTVEVKGTAVYYDADAFAARVETALKDRLPFDRALKEVNSESVEASLEKADALGNRANLRVFATGSAIISPDAPPLDPEKIAGVTTDAAVQYLTAVEGVSSASVDIRPFWAGRLPNVADHIKVEVR